MMIRVLILSALILLLDIYVYQGVKVLLRSSSPGAIKITNIIFWSLTVYSILVIAGSFMIPEYAINKALRTYFLSVVVILVVSKVLFALFLFIDDLFRLFRWIMELITSDKGDGATENLQIGRLKFLSQIGLVVAAVPFLSLIYGMTKGAFNYYIQKHTLRFGGIPQGSRGLKLLQISDLHTGSFNSDYGLQKAVKLIMEQKADVIVFTGDLVNNIADEALRFSEVLSRIKAPLGVYSVLGNHDYGDYVRWNSEVEKELNFKKMMQAHAEFGWNLLMDEHLSIQKDGWEFNIVGVQNWSAKPQFRKHGDLSKAVGNLDKNAFNILLSHDPSHWRAEVLENFPFIDLTLSGHTHGFQFGVQIPGFKWSPVQYVYKEWSGIYRNGKQHLYVNKGLGFLGYPGRVGMSPEITLFDLQPELS